MARMDILWDVQVGIDGRSHDVTAAGMNDPSTSRKRNVSQAELTMDISPPPKRAPETTLERVPDDLDNATHARLDVRVLDIVDGFNPTFLLTTIVDESDGMLDPTYFAPSKAKVLLREHPQLEVELKKAWDQRSFRDIRNLGTSASHPNKNQMVLTQIQRSCVRLILQRQVNIESKRN